MLQNQESFDDRKILKTWCRDVLTRYFGVDPNVVFLWNTDAEYGQIFNRMPVPAIFYGTCLVISSA